MSQYPHMVPISSAPLDAMHRTRLSRAARAICRRTGLNCMYNRHNDSLLFYSGAEPFGGPLRLDAFRRDGGERRYSDIEIDDAVKYVQMCRMPRAQKERIAARNEQLEKFKADEETEKYLADRRPVAQDYADFRSRKRRGVAKVISA